jgi:hypothetical protein
MNSTLFKLLNNIQSTVINIIEDLKIIINWVVRELNADWLKAVVYQTIYHGYDKTFIIYCSNYVGNQFIIEIRHLGDL